MSSAMENEKHVDNDTTSPPKWQASDSTKHMDPVDQAEENTDAQAKAESNVLHGKKLVIIFVALMLCLFLIALDQTILATALPRIASEFNEFTSQGWVASAFVLTQTAFILFYSQMLSIFPARDILLVAVFVFELGSLVCGVSKSMSVLIFGRALSGVGGAGIFVAIIQIVAQATKLEDRPKFMGAFSSIFGISSIVGPLIGGALTDNVTWRWCFYINLPIGGFSVAMVLLLLKRTPPLGTVPEERTWKNTINKTLNMDWVGTVLSLGAVTVLVLGLQWGGNTKPWNDGSVIACLVVGGVLFIVFGAWEMFIGDKALVPLKIFKSASVYCINGYTFWSRFAMLQYAYYIPIYYQATKAHSATKSGVDLLPLMLGIVVTSIVSGQLVSRIGYYWPFLILGSCFVSIGGGLLYTIDPDIDNANVIGYQIIAGVGIGLMMVNSIFAIQAEFRAQPHLVAQATGMASFCQFLGGTIGLAIAQSAFGSELSKNIAKYAPQAPTDIIKESPVEIHNVIPDDLFPSVILAFTKSLDIVFVLGVPAGGISLIFALFIKNIYIKADKKKKDEENNNKQEIDKQEVESK